MRGGPRTPLCPYCAWPAPVHSGIQVRGQWLVHELCQEAAEQRRVYLLNNGMLAIHEHLEPAVTAYKIIRLVRAFLLAGRRRLG